MKICLFTDFGAADLYVGQVKSVLHQHAADATIIDLLHEAPPYSVKAAAHLLAALVPVIPAETVTMAVVDPGVGSARRGVAMRADGRWYVGPDNGLLSVVAARARDARYYAITWRPQGLSASFHGRDLFAPTAAMIARGASDAAHLEAADGLEVRFGGEDLPEVIYIDHYGNAMTGLRANGIARDARLRVEGHRIPGARVFSDVPRGKAFWYENSVGLAEIAVNMGHAAAKMSLRVGHAIVIETG